MYGEDIAGDQLTPLEKEANIGQHLMPDIFGKGERLDGATYMLAKAYVLAHQYAQTIAALLGLHFTAQHPVAGPVGPLAK
jgi:hypothetical protein